MNDKQSLLLAMALAEQFDLDDYYFAIVAMKKLNEGLRMLKTRSYFRRGQGCNNSRQSQDVSGEDCLVKIIALRTKCITNQTYIAMNVTCRAAAFVPRLN